MDIPISGGGLGVGGGGAVAVGLGVGVGVTELLHSANLKLPMRVRELVSA